mmetsp:Transcript_62684/g.168088  ORF Transcript_62684/g.168088 Transcript_62684/m.168088 type:complete len:90 (+) Transcript_62684:193-462(+)
MFAQAVDLQPKATAEFRRLHMRFQFSGFAVDWDKNKKLHSKSSSNPLALGGWNGWIGNLLHTNLTGTSVRAVSLSIACQKSAMLAGERV